MRYGIISDIHGNLEALEEAMNALSHEKVDRIMQVGDIVGYGANPVECVRNSREAVSAAVCGNHDAGAAGLISTRYFNDIAERAVIWTRKRLEKEDASFLKGLPFVYRDSNLTLVHGTLNSPEEFYYMLDRNAAGATFDRMDTRICFVGHTHVPGIFSLKDGDVKHFMQEEYYMSKKEKLIVNAGSVGQPRDGDPRLSYCVYDSELGIVKLKRLPYNVKKAQDKILMAGLPAFLAYRLGGGT